MKALKSHELNFYTKYQFDPEKQARNRKLFVLILPWVILVSALAAIIANLYVEQNSLNSKLEILKAELSDPVVNENYDRAIYYSQALEGLDAEVEAINMFKSIKDTYPTIASDEIHRIIGCSVPGMRIDGISAEPADGIIYATVLTGNVSSIPEYIRNLKDTGLFDDVSYEGYTSEMIEGIYDYTVIVTMHRAAPEGKLDMFLGDYGITEGDYSEDAGSEEEYDESADDSSAENSEGAEENEEAASDEASEATEE